VRRSIWILLALLAALLALTLFLENREVEQPIIGTETSRLIPNFLFSAKNGLVTSLKIENVEEYGISLQRGTDGLWDVLEPEGVEIEQGVAEAAVSQVLALPLLAEELSISPLDVGIGKQAPLVEVGFADDAVSVFRVGNLTSSGSGYYIQYEKEKIGIVGRDGLDSLFKLLLLFE
jgi:hypothetical protein